MLSLVPPWITGKICLKSPHSSMHIPPIGRSLPVKSLSVRSRTSNASLFVMGVSSTIIALLSCITLQSAVPTYGNVHCVQI